MRNLTYRWTSPQLSASGAEILQAVVQSGQWSYGPVARQTERAIASHLGSGNVVLTNTGTSALWALLAIAKKPLTTQSIIVPAFGYSAAANVAASLGYRIYVADSLPDAPIIDPASVHRLMDKTVSAVVGINYFGYAADWDELPVNDDQYMLIEDAAGSYGARYNERPCGTNAANAIFSFHTSKAAAAGGEGGGVVSQDEAIAQQVRMVARNGHRNGYYYAESTGLNLLMTDVAASFLRDSISTFNEGLPARRHIVERLDQLFTEIGLQPSHFNHSVNGRTQSYQTYAVLIDNRDLVTATLRLNGIEARPCWPHLLTQQPAFNDAIAKVDGTLDNALYFTNKIINIPVNPYIPAAHLDRLAEVLQRMKHAGLLITKKTGRTL